MFYLYENVPFQTKNHQHSEYRVQILACERINVEYFRQNIYSQIHSELLRTPI